MRAAAWYYALQGAAVPAWWVSLAVWPAFRGIFELGAPAVLRSFLLPDVAFAAASLLAAGLIVRGRRAATAAVAGITAGAVGYSTVMTIGHVLTSGEGVVGAVAMTLATLGSAASLLAVVRGAS